MKTNVKFRFLVPENIQNNLSHDSFQKICRGKDFDFKITNQNWAGADLFHLFEWVKCVKTHLDGYRKDCLIISYPIQSIMITENMHRKTCVYRTHVPTFSGCIEEQNVG